MVLLKLSDMTFNLVGRQTQFHQAVFLLMKMDPTGGVGCSS